MTEYDVWSMAALLPTDLFEAYMQAAQEIALEINHDGRYGSLSIGVEKSWWGGRNEHPEFVLRCATKYAELYQLSLARQTPAVGETQND